MSPSPAVVPYDQAPGVSALDLRFLQPKDVSKDVQTEPLRVRLREHHRLKRGGVGSSGVVDPGIVGLQEIQRLLDHRVVRRNPRIEQGERAEAADSGLAVGAETAERTVGTLLLLQIADPAGDRLADLLGRDVVRQTLLHRNPHRHQQNRQKQNSPHGLLHPGG